MRFKQFLITASLLILCDSTSAQFALEHTYALQGQMWHYKIENEGDKYLGVAYASNSIKLYNTDHSLWKNIVATLPVGATGLGAYFPSTLLFDNDNGVEVVIYYYVPSGANSIPETAVINEDGSIIQVITGYYSPLIYQMDGDWKLQVSNYTPNGTDYRVYTLPGTAPLGAKSPTNTLISESSLSPNPFNVAATLSYKMPVETNEASLVIYSQSGQLVQTYHITNAFSEITLQRGSLPSGMYHYQIMANNYVSQAKSFIIQ